MRRLIVNADDFGLHEAANRGIQQAHLQGIVTSTSLMPGGVAFEDAVNIAGGCPKLGVGVHLTLVGGSPVAPVAQVSSLVDAQGCFCSSYPVFLSRFLRGDIRLAEVEQELEAQIEKVLAAGLIPTQLDSHQHLHVVPGISGVVLKLARRFSIRAIRIPAEPLLFFGGKAPSLGRVIGRTGLTLLAEAFRRQAVGAGLAVTGHFFGMLSGGQMNQSALLSILQSLPEGDSEIMVHPGDGDESLAEKYSWGYHWTEELQALCSGAVKTSVGQQKIQLISYREL